MNPARMFLESLDRRPGIREHIDPPASSYAIMRRACPYRGENHEPGKDVFGES
jgi:hypothetical protein